MFHRLYYDHHIISDDSYNIHFVSADSLQLENSGKKEVLFDVTDYKMKNQQKLSDTTRKILTKPPERRSRQDIKLVRNIVCGWPFWR